MRKSFGAEVVEALGLQDKRVFKLQINLDAGEIPTIDLTLGFLDPVDQSRFLEVLSRYKLTAKETECP